MSHQRAASTSSISSNGNEDNQHQRSSSLRFARGGPVVDIPAANNSTAAAAGTPTSPLSISIPRQRSFSSSLSFATSPSARTLTGSSIIANPNNGYFTSGVTGGPTTPLSAVFAPISPASATPPTGGMTVGSLPSPSVSTGASQAMPVLHRRFSSSFHQLNQMTGTSPNGTSSQAIPDRGRRASYFGGSSNSPPNTAAAPGTGPDLSSSGPSGASGLFRKFSTTGRSAGHPFDRNDTGPANLGGAQPNSQNKQQPLQQLQAALAHASDNLPNQQQQQQRQQHLSAVDKLKPSQDKPSRSSSPMRSMILTGQMLD
ncbi:hypothetical protein B0O80DRAFT_494701 [Mortierella sp. GBAus27b]|nr:hypothetical protein BGX31_000753 [Mortierella sp. GBA43]KAI8360539.1 hypothetical protein B0O80DRAFT_494701 [Mortierella sp. GBAus27b]